MSVVLESIPSPSRSRAWALWVLGVVLLLAVAAWLWFVWNQGPRNAYGLGGVLKLEAPAGMRLYVGDKLVGTGTTELSWDDIFGVEGQPGLAVMLQPNAGAAAEKLVEPNMVILDIKRSGDTKVANNEGISLSAANERWLVQRADGQIDLVFVLIGSVSATHQQERHFILFIRPRFGPEGHSAYIEPGSHGGTSRGKVLFGVIPGKLDQHWQFMPAEPPSEFAEAIKQKGLWEPKPR